jgi:hypothetical protein
VDVTGVGQYLCTRRHTYDQLVTIAPVAQRPGPVTAALRTELLAAAKSLEIA